MIARVLFGVLLLVAGFDHGLLAAEVEDRVYSVCEVMALPAALNGKVVRVRGMVMSTGHGAYLESPECPAPFSVGEDTLPRAIFLAYESEFGKPVVRNAAHMKQVEKQIRGLRRKGKPAPLLLTYTGIFETRTEWQVLSFRSGGARLWGFGHLAGFPAQLVVMDMANPAYAKQK